MKQNKSTKDANQTKVYSKNQRPSVGVEPIVRRFFSIFRKSRPTVQTRNSFGDWLNFKITLTGSDIIDIVNKYTKI